MTLPFSRWFVKRVSVSNAWLSPKDTGGDRDPRRWVPVRGRLYPSLHCHHHNDFCIKMSSDESSFVASLTVRGKASHELLTTNRLFSFLFKREGSRSRIEPSHGPSAYHPIPDRWANLYLTPIQLYLIKFDGCL